MASEVILRINNLHVSIEDTEILRGLDLEIRSGEIHALMGRNGSGKSTLANVLMGHPAYEITDGTIEFFGEDLSEMEPWERARAGLFLILPIPTSRPRFASRQFPSQVGSAIRGENAPGARDFRAELNTAMEELDVDKQFLGRYVNDGFSGGEKSDLRFFSCCSINPSCLFLDETDSGLDIDALQTVSKGINASTTDETGLIITHYQRILDHVKPSHVHIMIDGQFVKSWRC